MIYTARRNRYQRRGQFDKQRQFVADCRAGFRRGQSGNESNLCRQRCIWRINRY